ncbi:unnamed protein product, partial [Prunus brigantina]
FESIPLQNLEGENCEHPVRGFLACEFQRLISQQAQEQEVLFYRPSP